MYGGSLRLDATLVVLLENPGIHLILVDGPQRLGLDISPVGQVLSSSNLAQSPDPEDYLTQKCRRHYRVVSIRVDAAVYAKTSLVF